MIGKLLSSVAVGHNPYPNSFISCVCHLSVGKTLSCCWIYTGGAERPLNPHFCRVELLPCAISVVSVKIS